MGSGLSSDYRSRVFQNGVSHSVSYSLDIAWNECCVECIWVAHYLNAMVFGMGEVDQEAPEDDRRQWRGGGYPEEPRLPLALPK